MSLHGWQYCYQKWNLPAHRSKANEEARLVEKKVCFISEASNQGWGQTPVVQSQTYFTDNQWARAFKGAFQGWIGGRRGLYAETALSALTVILNSVIQWSDQHHLDCFEYSQSLVPRSICSHFFEASSQNCGSFCHRYSLVNMLLTSSTW